MKYFVLYALDFASHLMDRASLSLEMSDAIWSGEKGGLPREFIIQVKKKSVRRAALLWHCSGLPLFHKDLSQALEERRSFPHAFFPVTLRRGTEVLSAAYRIAQVPNRRVIDLEASDVILDNYPGHERAIERARRIVVDQAAANNYPVVFDRRIGRKLYLVSEEFRVVVSESFRGVEVNNFRYLDIDNAEDMSYLV